MNNLIWLQDALKEKLYYLKIHSDQLFRYHISVEEGSEILYIPLVPNYILKNRKHISIYVPNYGNLSLILDLDKLGYVLEDDLLIPKNGFCHLPDEIVSELNFFVEQKKRDIIFSLHRFMNALTSTVQNWRMHYILAQHSGSVLNLSDIQLDIIHSKSGYGKSHEIINSFQRYDGRVVIVVFGDGAEANIEENTDGMETFFYSERKGSKDKFRKYMLSNMKHSDNPAIRKLQLQWQKLIGTGSIQSFLLVFSPNVVVREWDLLRFNKTIKHTNFNKVYVDDANNFHPWNILDILPISKNIFIAGDDEGQLLAKRDFEYLVHRLQIPSLKVKNISKYIKGSVKTKQMNLDEPLSTKDFISGNLRTIAKMMRSGISFPPKKVKIHDEVNYHLKKVSQFQNQSLLTIFDEWPVSKTTRILPIKLSIQR